MIYNFADGSRVCLPSSPFQIVRGEIANPAPEEELKTLPIRHRSLFATIAQINKTRREDRLKYPSSLNQIVTFNLSCC